MFVRYFAYNVPIGFAMAMGTITGAHGQTPAGVAELPSETLSSGEVQQSQNREGEIVVMARRRSERLQDVPLAVTAFSAASLQQSGVTNTIEIANQTPGLVLTTQSAGLTAFIRGVGSTDVSAGQEASVATYIDGVYVASPYGAIFSLNNVERVEVLKGPQGTLFGRNATGGILQVITRTPQHDPSLEGSLAYENYDTIQGKLYGTTGLSDTLAADVALFYRNQRDPYGRNVDTGADNIRTREFAIRSKMVFEPVDALSFTLSGGYYRNQVVGTGSSRQLYPGLVALDGVTTYTGGYYNTTGNVTGILHVRGYDVALTGQADLGAVNLKSITSYRRLKVRHQFDNDFTTAAIVDAYIDAQVYRTFTQEVQLSSPEGSPLSWIAGTFFMHDQSGFGGDHGLGLFGSGIGLPAPMGVGLRNMIRTNSYSAFGEVTVPLGASTKFTAGARYTADHRRISGVTYILSDAVTFEKVGATIIPSNSATFNKLTYRAILDHHFTRDIMAYGSFSRGFKSGNFNTGSPLDPAFRPEVLDALEVGVKSDLFDRLLRLNAALYRYNYKDLQLPIQTGPSISTVNAASARITGVEIEGTLNASRQFKIDFGANYLHTRFRSFPNAPCLVPSSAGADTQCGVVPISACTFATSTPIENQFVCDLTGNQLPRAPKWTFNIQPVYSLTTKIGKFTLSAAYNHNSGYFWDSQNTLRQKAYDLLNSSLSWQSSSEALTARLYAKNITKTEYATFAYSSLTGDGYAPAPPRTYGVELGFKF